MGLLQTPTNTVDVSQPGKCIFHWPNYKDKTVECVTYDTSGLAAETGTSDTCWAFQCQRTVLAGALRQKPGTQQHARQGPRTDDDINAIALRQCQHQGQPGHENATAAAHAVIPALTLDVLKKHTTRVTTAM